MTTLKEILQQIRIPDHRIKGVPVMSWTGLSNKQIDAVLFSVQFWLESKRNPEPTSAADDIENEVIEKLSEELICFPP